MKNFTQTSLIDLLISSPGFTKQKTTWDTLIPSTHTLIQLTKNPGNLF